MKTVRFWYIPEAEVRFTREEVESLILLSERHHDYKCRELSRRGGVLYGMRNMFDKDGDRDVTIAYRLDAGTADLLAKVAEYDPMLLKLVRIVKMLNQEWRIHNAENLNR